MKDLRGNVGKLALIQFFANLYFYLPVSTLYLQSKNLSFLQINSLWGIIVGTMFLAEVPTGVLADRVGRKRAVNIALALQVLGELIFLFAGNYWAFALAAVTGGLGFAFASGSLEALVYDSLKSGGEVGEMARAMGFIDAGKRIANLLAFALGGWLTVRLTAERFSLAIAVTAAAVALAWLTSFTLRESPAEAQLKARKSGRHLLANGIQLLRENTAFRRLVWLALASIPFVDYLMNLYQPRFIALGVPAIWLGLGLALASAVGILGARYAYLLERHLSPRLGLLLVTLLPAILYLGMALAAQPALSVLAFILLYGSTSLKEPVFSGHLNRHIESENRATVLSLISMFSGFYVALMGLVIGRVADSSLTAAFLLMGSIVLAGALFFRAK